jgi:hypothetical protein
MWRSSRMLDHIHFLACMYIMMWLTKKEKHVLMIEAKFDDFHYEKLCMWQLDYPTTKATKQLIYNSMEIQ